MKLSQIIYILGLSFLLSVPAFAQDCSVLVLPEYMISNTQQSADGNKYDEFLANKLISNIKTNISAPELKDITPSKTGVSSDNLKALHDKFGAKKVIIIKSDIESQSPDEQKILWQQLGVPVITQSETNRKIVTTVKIYDTQTGKLIWNDSYYKRVSPEDLSEDMMKEYYSLLSSKIAGDIKMSKDNHAVIVSDAPKVKEKPTAKTEENKLLAKWKNSDSKPLTNKTKNISTKTKQKKITENVSIYTLITDPKEIPSALRYLQVSPRIKSQNYTLSFDNTVNDL